MDDLEGGAAVRGGAVGVALAQPKSQGEEEEADLEQQRRGRESHGCGIW